MIEAGMAELEESPVGRFTSTGSCVIWCASATLFGWYAWGRPDEAETRTICRLADRAVEGRHPKIAQKFNVVVDTRGIEAVAPLALTALVAWLFKHRHDLKQRVQLQASVIRQDSTGFLFAGILPSLGESHTVRIFTEATDAFRAIAGEPGVAIAEEIERIVANVRGVPHELHVLRALLASRIDATIEEAAKMLSTSPRSLQRKLALHGTSFRREVTDARFAVARELLATTNTKIAGVATHVGLSERGLTLIFKEKTGFTPADWRKQVDPR